MESKLSSYFLGYLNLAQAFRPPDAGSASELALTYTQLFLGPGRPIAWPYESVYIEGQLSGKTTEQVARCYTEAGLQVSNENRELPDHIAFELAFMAHLVSREERDHDRAELWRQRQRHFLDQHLTKWLPEFCRRIERSDAHPFYRQAAQLARQIVEDHRTYLSHTLAGGVDQTNGRPQPSTHVNPPRISSGRRPRRFPNVRLSVISSQCTLCTLCADACRQGALTIHSKLTTLNLVFQATRCNGCRACLRLCPENAITLELDSPLSLPNSNPEKVVITAPRVVCPRCNQPHIAVPWLERLAWRLGGNESVRLSLALCPFCKTAADVGRGVMAEFSQRSIARG